MYTISAELEAAEVIVIRVSPRSHFARAKSVTGCWILSCPPEDNIMRIPITTFVTLLAVAVFPAPQTRADDATDRLAISARLERLSTIRVVYNIVYRTTDGKGLMVFHVHQGGKTDVTNIPSGIAKHITFTLAHGLARWDSTLVDEALKPADQEKVADLKHVSESYDGKVRQTLATNRAHEVGSVMVGDRNDRWLALELGLGLYTNEDGQWITDSLLSEMTLRPADVIVCGCRILPTRIAALNGSSTDLWAMLKSSTGACTRTK